MTAKEFEIQYALGTLSYDMKIELSYNKNTSKDILSTLSKDKDCDVRYWVARNNNTPKKILLVLSKDENCYVKCSVNSNSNYKG